MISPAVPRWVAAVLSHATRGVNALRLLVPQQPDEAAPPPVAIYNVVDDQWLAQGQLDDEARVDEWVLAIGLEQEFDLAGSPGEGTVDDTVTVVVILDGVVAEGKNADALAQAFRVMRCVRRGLQDAFMRLGMEELVLEEQLVSPPSQMKLFTNEVEKGSGRVQLVLELPFTITDTWALTPIPEP